MMFVFHGKNALWKACVCLGFLTVLYLSGCQTQQPPFKPVVTPVKPPTLIKEQPYVMKQLDRYKVRDWKYVVIHHSASDSGNAAIFDKNHREVRHWNSLGYHFVIGNGHGSGDGQIEIGDRWIKQIDGAHAAVHEYNHFGVGICLVGNFNTTDPTVKQMASLTTLVAYLQERCRIPSEKIVLHKSVRETECPGRKFPYDKLLAQIARYQ